MSVQSSSPPVPTAADPVPISVVLPARNEELNIEEALASVRWADEVWVVDSHSTDRTQEIAEGTGARVVQFDYPGHGPKKKNWALANLPLRNEWVLILDADERVPDALRAEFQRAVSVDEAAGYYVDRDYFFLGRSLHCFRPNWNMRLFKHKLGRYEPLGTEASFTGDNEVHEHVILQGHAKYLETPLRHEDRRPLRAWVENHNRYSEWEAEVYQRFRNEPLGLSGLFSPEPVWRRRAIKRLWVRMPMRPLLRFFSFYLIRRGFLDGHQGLAYAVLMSYYEFLISLKLLDSDLKRTERSQQGTNSIESLRP